MGVGAARRLKEWSLQLGSKGHPAGGAHRLGILCVAWNALLRLHVATSLLSLKPQLSCQSSGTFSGPQSKIASLPFTLCHFIFFIELSLPNILLLIYDLFLPNWNEGSMRPRALFSLLGNCCLEWAPAIRPMNGWMWGWTHHEHKQAHILKHWEQV